jgi:hypothetical protein
MRVLTKNGAVEAPRARELLSTQLKNRMSMRARASLPIARALAPKFQPLNQKVTTPPRPAPSSGTSAAGALPDVAFDVNVAAFAFDDASGTEVDSQFLDSTTGAFDLQVVEDSPVSIWVGTYDMASATANVVEPISYGFEDDIPPATTDVSYNYDPYFYVDPTTTASFDGSYAPATADQAGYYELAFSGGTSYLYLLADDAAVGSYYAIWDDGTCSQGTQVYVGFDTSGSYFTVNGVDGAFSLSGVSTAAGTFAGSSVRWDVVADDGQNYQDLVTVSYLADASNGPSCPGAALVDPCTAGGCALTCPAGCSLDLDFGICTINGTIDAATGVGISCETADLSQNLIVCPTGCAEPVPADGYCYVGGSTSAAICY